MMRVFIWWRGGEGCLEGDRKGLNHYPPSLPAFTSWIGMTNTACLPYEMLLFTEMCLANLSLYTHNHTQQGCVAHTNWHSYTLTHPPTHPHSHTLTQKLLIHTYVSGSSSGMSRVSNLLRMEACQFLCAWFSPAPPLSHYLYYHNPPHPFPHTFSIYQKRHLRFTLSYEHKSFVNNKATNELTLCCSPPSCLFGASGIPQTGVVLKQIVRCSLDLANL